MKKLHFVAAGFQILIALAGLIGPSNVNAEPGIDDVSIKWGMSAPLSGPNAAYGKAMREGIECHFAEINSRGGIGGRRLRAMLNKGLKFASQWSRSA